MRLLDDEKQIGVWDQRMSELAARTFAPDIKLVELFQALNLAPQRAVDLGCGPGRHLVWLAERGWQVTGLDWSSRALDDARRALDSRGLSGELIKGDIRTPPDLGAPFQLAVATRVFHHGLLSDYKLAIKSLRRLLSAGGHAIISLPSASMIPLNYPVDWVEERTLVPTEGDEAGIPHHFFTEEEVREYSQEFSSVKLHKVREQYEEQTAQGPQLVKREWLWVVLGV